MSALQATGSSLALFLLFLAFLLVFSCPSRQRHIRVSAPPSLRRETPAPGPLVSRTLGGVEILLPSAGAERPAEPAPTKLTEKEHAAEAQRGGDVGKICIKIQSRGSDPEHPVSRGWV